MTPAWIALGAVWAGLGLWLWRSARSARLRAGALLEEARRGAALERARTVAAVQEALAKRRADWERERQSLRAEQAEREERQAKILAHLEDRERAAREREAREREEAAASESRAAALPAAEGRIQEARRAQTAALLERSGLPAEAARQAFLKDLEAAVRHEAEARWDRVLREQEAEAESLGRDVLHVVLNRIRTRQTLEPQHNHVRLRPDTLERWFGPKGDLKAKLEELTGAELVRQPPEAPGEPEEVRISAYDGVWREVAKLVLQECDRRGVDSAEALPEMVRQHDAVLSKTLAKTARRFLEGMRLRDVHPDIVKAMGRLRFRTSYGQNILEHSVEAGFIAAHLASEIGLDSRLAMRCGLLHDLGKALTTADGGMHDDLGAELAKRCGEHEAVIGAIDGHHGANNNPYTKLAMAGDAISGARPGARRETYEKYVERIRQLEAIAASFPGVNGVTPMKAGREVRVDVQPGLADEEVVALAGRIAERIENEVIFPGEIHVTAIKETKVVERAR